MYVTGSDLTQIFISATTVIIKADIIMLSHTSSRGQYMQVGW